MEHIIIMYPSYNNDFKCILKNLLTELEAFALSKVL